MSMGGLAPVAVKKKRHLLIITCTRSLKKYFSKKYCKIYRDRGKIYLNPGTQNYITNGMPKALFYYKTP